MSQTTNTTKTIPSVDEVTVNNKVNQNSGPQMNMKLGDFETEQINNLLREAREIAVVPAKTAGADSFCAAAGLFLMLQEKYAHAEGNDKKNVKFLYSGKVPEVANGLVDERNIVDNINERELMLSIDYSGTQATKIQYDNDKNEEIFYFKLGPVSKNFDTNRIKAKIVGFDFDLLFVVGAQELIDLGPIYNNLRNEINKAKKINLDITNRNKRFGIVNIIDDKADTLSTLVFKNSSNWNLTPTTKTAKALLTGMTYREAKHG